jgi:hypothetical protein
MWNRGLSGRDGSFSLSGAQPDEIVAYGTAEAARHLDPISEKNVPQKAPQAVPFRLPTNPQPTKPSPSTGKTSFVAWAGSWMRDLGAVLRLYGLMFERWFGRLFWRRMLRRCPDYGCHRKLFRAYLKPYGFPGLTCPNDHHFYIDKGHETW